MDKLFEIGGGGEGSWVKLLGNHIEVKVGLQSTL